jgi:predicted nucleotidyltransferase
MSSTTEASSIPVSLSAAARAARAGKQSARIAGLRSALAGLSAQDVTAVLLFGSWARGDFDGGSDIDLLLVTTGETLSAAALAVVNNAPDAQRFDVLTVPAARWAQWSVDHPFYARIAAQAVVLWPAPSASPLPADHPVQTTSAVNR